MTRQIRSQFGDLGFVPTMGALHRGHLSLVRRAKHECKAVAVSIFVNPLQFGPAEDFSRYPRQLDADLALLGNEGVDIAFVPQVQEMFPTEFGTHVAIDGIDEKSEEGKVRPGHFRGVCTVVNKLLNIVQPRKAFFGAKDAVQCIVIRKMVRDLSMDQEIVVADTVRERDGLAMSSRNQYLTQEERKAAPILYRALSEAHELFRRKETWSRSSSGVITKRDLVAKVTQILRTEPLVSSIQYISVMDAHDAHELSDSEPISLGSILSLAVVVGKVRLIDNTTLDV